MKYKKWATQQFLSQNSRVQKNHPLVKQLRDKAARFSPKRSSIGQGYFAGMCDAAELVASQLK